MRRATLTIWRCVKPRAQVARAGGGVWIASRSGGNKSCFREVLKLSGGATVLLANELTKVI